MGYFYVGIYCFWEAQGISGPPYHQQMLESISSYQYIVVSLIGHRIKYLLLVVDGPLYGNLEQTIHKNPKRQICVDFLLECTSPLKILDKYILIF